MNLTDAKIRSMSAIIKQNEYAAQIGNPDNARSDMEIIARLILAEENNLEAMVNIAQELWNRRRYRKIFGMGGGLQWRVNEVKDDARYAGKWKEILYADGQYRPIQSPYNNTMANPMGATDADLNTKVISERWRFACELAFLLTHPTGLNIGLDPFVKPVEIDPQYNYTVRLGDQLYHRGYADSEDNANLRSFLYNNGYLNSKNENWHGKSWDYIDWDGGRYDCLMLGDTMFFNDSQSKNNDIHLTTRVIVEVPDEPITNPPKVDAIENNTRLPIFSDEEFVEFLVSRVGCGYAYGSYGQMCDDALIDKLKTKNPSESSNLEVSRNKWRGRYVCDCSGLIKWFLLKKGVTNCDTNANGMYKNWCYYTSTKMDVGFTFPGRYLLFRISNGKAVHVGVYIGNNKIVEAKGAAYGVVVTEYVPSEWHAWGIIGWIEGNMEDWEGPAANLQVVADASTIPTNLGLNEGVSGIQSYSTSTSSVIYKEGDSGSSVEMMRRRLWAENNSFTVNDYFDSVLNSAIKSFQTANSLTVDGIVGSTTWRALFPIIEKKTGVRPGVVAAQALLNYQNYPVGTPDGMFGTGSETVLKAFQRDHELESDGIIGDKTWEALTLTVPSQTQVIVPEAVKCQLGDSGLIVMQVQNRLSMWGYAFPQPGYFDAYTKVKVESFQNIHGISIDGIVGVSTWARLFPLLKKAYGVRDNVEYLQRALNHQLHRVTVDGMFGSGTEEAVKAYQTMRNLTSDGIVGEGTWTSLFTDAPTGSIKDFGYGGSGTSGSSLLKLGQDSTEIRQVKRRMWADGLFSGTINTSFDTMLERSIRDFQHSKGARVDGIIGSVTWSLLFPVVKKKTGQQEGAKAVQTLLNSNGYSVGTPDGLFGTGSETKLIQFQTAKGLTPDGVCGEKTWAALCLI